MTSNRTMQNTRKHKPRSNSFSLFFEDSEAFMKGNATNNNKGRRQEEEKERITEERIGEILKLEEGTSYKRNKKGEA